MTSVLQWLYSLRVDGNGNVEFNGISDVKTLGKHVTKISPQDLKRVLHEFKDVYFFSFNDSYEFSSNQSSSQHQQQQQQTSISLRLGDKYKKVKYVEEAYRVPSELKSLVGTIEKITKVDQLVRYIERTWVMGME